MKKVTANRIYITVILVVIAALVVTQGMLSYAGKLRETFQEEIVSTLSEVSEQGAQTFSGLTKRELIELQDLSELIAERMIHEEMPDILNALSTAVENNNFMRMGVIMPDGTAYTTDSLKLDLGARDFFDKSMVGHPNVSQVLSSTTDGSPIIVYSVPIYEGKKIVGVLFAAHLIADYHGEVEVKTFSGQGYSYVVRKNGDSVLASTDPTSFQDFKNVISSIKRASPNNTQCAEELRQSMMRGSNGYVVFNNKIDKYMYYRPLGVNDWFLLTVVPTGVVNGKMDNIMWSTYMLCGLIVLLFLSMMIFILFVNMRNRHGLERIAYVDKLTGYMSYEKFRIEAENLLKDHNREKYAVVALDLDKFRYINDLFGYPEGNKVIVFMADVLNKELREGELFAHRTGDWFILLMEKLSKEELTGRVERICTTIRDCRGSGKQYDLNPSAGIYEVESAKLDISAMVDRAELAQKAVKNRRKYMVAFYDDRIRSRQLNDKRIEGRMVEALKNEDFTVYYQPKYNVETQQISGAEALVRWRVEDGSILPPSEFIPLFEANGFITELDKYVFTQVCRSLRGWLDAGQPVVPISVNLSRVHLYSPDFVDEYCAILDSYNLPKGLVQLELTESALFGNLKTMVALIDRLQEMGFDILMDDFGTGYSSLTMLKDVPINVLKLDKAFIDGLVDDKGKYVLKNIIVLSHELNIPVIAEGVETIEQYVYLKSVGCDEIQGYYFARPMPSGNFNTLLIDSGEHLNEKPASAPIDVAASELFGNEAAVDTSAGTIRADNTLTDEE